MAIENDVSLVLVEFDSLKGPVIRKKNPDNYNLPEDSLKEEFLMWVIRSNDFSVRKINSHTAYAKTISLNDPNFSRKKRQFGLTIISKFTFNIAEAEFIFDNLIDYCMKNYNNKSYFKILNGLLLTIKDFKFPKAIFSDGYECQEIQQSKKNISFEKITHQSKIDFDNDLPHFVVSKKMQLFDKISIRKKIENCMVIISSSSNYPKEKSVIEREIESENSWIKIESQKLPENFQVGLSIVLRIIDSMQNFEMKIERIRILLEYFDRLLLEDVDIEYFLPFGQYLISMENYVITKFKKDDFERQISELMDTHGSWIDCLLDKELDGKNLSEFFDICELRRESLELLIDLLFVKLIVIL